MKSLVVWCLGAAAAGALLASGGGCSGGTLSGTGGGMVNAGGRAGTGILGLSGSGFIGGAAGCGCCAHDVPTQRLAPDIMLLLDTSTTMNEPIDDPCVPTCTPPSKWAAATDAIRSAVAGADAEVDWGFAFMGSPTDACAAGLIEIPVGWPTVGLGSLLNSRTSPTGALVGAGSRPMRAAINQAAAHLADQRSGGRQLIVLITDNVPQCRPGAPNVLEDDVDGTAAAITAAAGSNIATYLIGLSGGTPIDGRLFQLALNGHVLDDHANVSSSGSAAGVRVALEDIVAHTAECTFAVPPPPTDDGTTSRGLIRVKVNGNDVGMDNTNGWTYTDASLQGIQLYGFTCDAVRGQETPNVAIEFPCFLP